MGHLAVSLGGACLCLGGSGDGLGLGGSDARAVCGKARIHIDSSSILRPLLRGLAIQPDINRQVALMSKTLFSRPNMEKLMRMTDLDLQVTNDLEKEALLSRLRSSLHLSSGGRGSSDIYSVSFKHEDRDVAKKVVQSVITVVVENTLGDKREDRAGAEEFIDQK